MDKDTVPTGARVDARHDEPDGIACRTPPEMCLIFEDDAIWATDGWDDPIHALKDSWRKPGKSPSSHDELRTPSMAVS
jgi:hypothetical protein